MKGRSTGAHVPFVGIEPPGFVSEQCEAICQHMKTTPGMIPLRTRAKVMDNVLSLRPTITHVAPKLDLFVWSVETPKLSDICPGTTTYFQRDYRSNASIARRTPEDDPEFEARGGWATKCFLMCVDERGVRYDLHIADPKYELLFPLERAEYQDPLFLDHLAEQVRAQCNRSLPPSAIQWRTERAKDLIDWVPENIDNPVSRRTRTFCALSLPCSSYIKRVRTFLESTGVFPPNGGGRVRFQVMEAEVKPMQKVLDGLGITVMQWITVDSWRLPDRYYTHSQVELEVKSSSIKSHPSRQEMPPIWIFSWDGEMYCSDRRFFVDSRRDKDHVIQWSTVIAQQGSDGKNFVSTCFYLGDVDRTKLPATVLLETCDDEEELHSRWRDFMVLDVQSFVNIGYNIDLFDTPFAWYRSQPREHRLGRYEDWEIEDRIAKAKNTAAAGSGSRTKKKKKGEPADIATASLSNSAWSLRTSEAEKNADAMVDDAAGKKKKNGRIGNILCVSEHRGGKSRFPYMSVFIHLKCSMTTYERSGQGKKGERHSIIYAAGRVSMDVLNFVPTINGYSWYSFKLKDVAMTLFEKDDSIRKIDLPMERLWDNHDRGPETRAENVIYGEMDCIIPLKIALRHCMIPNQTAIAMITRTSIDDVVHRGQTARIMNMITRECHRSGYVINSNGTNDVIARAMEIGDDVGFQGAKVLDPKPGYHRNPIMLNDFQSLYPSVMQANNLCYSTLLMDKELRTRILQDCDEVAKNTVLVSSAIATSQALSSSGNSSAIEGERFHSSATDYVHRKTGVRFRRFSSCESNPVFVLTDDGVFPTILAKLKAERKRVREQQETISKGSTKWYVLESLQLAIKVIANSVYGYTGALATWKYALEEVSATVTAEGRDMILFTKKIVETRFYTYVELVRNVALVGGKKYKLCAEPTGEFEKEYTVIKASGPPTVVYGDTDSVMGRTGLEPDDYGVSCAKVLSFVITQYITAMFHKDIILEPETVMPSMLLMGKKRYAYWNRFSDKLVAKGIEVKRRDNWAGLRNTMGKLLECLLKHNDTNAMLDATKATLRDIVADKLPIDDYIVTKALKDDYSRMTNRPPHVVVRDKIAERAKGSEPGSGFRVPYVITTTGPKDLVGERAEDPEYVKAHPDTIKIDRAYYMTTLAKPLLKTLDLVFSGSNHIFNEAQIIMNTLQRQQATGTDTCNSYVTRFDNAMKAATKCVAILVDGVPEAQRNTENQAIAKRAFDEFLATASSSSCSSQSSDSSSTPLSARLSCAGTTKEEAAARKKARMEAGAAGRSFRSQPFRPPWAVGNSQRKGSATPSKGVRTTTSAATLLAASPKSNTATAKGKSSTTTTPMVSSVRKKSNVPLPLPRSINPFFP